MNNNVKIVAVVVAFSLLAFGFGFALGNTSSDEVEEVAAAEGVFELRGEVNTNTEPFEISVEPIDGDFWDDSAYWMEAISYIAANNADIQGWTNQEILDYMYEYIEVAIQDYTVTE